MLSHSPATLDELATAFGARLAATRERHLALLVALCEIESGSEMVAGVERVAALVSERLSALGLRIERHAVDRGAYAAHLVARAGPEADGANGPPIVLGGHLDTTYSDYAELPRPHFTDDGAVLVGPGTADMRGGVLVLLAALDCLAAQGMLEALPVTVILNTDEERGAPSSRTLFEQHARCCRAALFAECAGPRGELVVARRAKLGYRLDVLGVGRHAGSEQPDKVSALVELSHQIVAIEALHGTPALDGVSFNVGRAWGGVASNTVPQRATALVDIRYPRTELEAPVRQALDAIVGRPRVAGARCTLTETSFRPAWPRSDQSAALFALAAQIADRLGQRVEPEARGGTADANWFGAAGVPCLDGLGPVGFDDHTPDERLVVSTLFDRALLTALLLVAIGHQPNFARDRPENAE